MNQKEQQAFDAANAKIAELESVVSELNIKLEELTNNADEALKNELADNKKALELELDNSAKKDVIIEEQAAKLAELQAASGEKVTASVVELPTIEYQGKTFKVLKARISVAGDATKYSAEELADNPEVIEKILSMEGQQLLQQMVD
jgi:hypothetical protein